jgi:hypothetical protein
MRLKRNNEGQVALEYAMAVTVVAAIGSLLWLFYQGYVVGSLYGGSKNWNVLGTVQGNKALGLEKAVSLPIP